MFAVVKFRNRSRRETCELVVRKILRHEKIESYDERSAGFSVVVKDGRIFDLQYIRVMACLVRNCRWYCGVLIACD